MWLVTGKSYAWSVIIAQIHIQISEVFLLCMHSIGP